MGSAKEKLLEAFIGKALQMPNGDYITFMGNRFVYFSKSSGRIIRLKLVRIEDV